MIQGSVDMREVKLRFVERRHEYADVYTYIFSSDEKISYTAGQYGHVRLFGMPEGVKAVREFSFASAPHEDALWFGVDSRSGSPYQKRLMELNPEDEAGLFKIKGHMSWPVADYEKVVMIAGGIGITPFRSQILDSAHKKLPLDIILIHTSKDEYLYGDELAPLVSAYHPVRREELQQAVTDAISAHPQAMYFIAGPTGFVETVNGILHAAGITAIQGDTFKGLEE